MSAERFAMQLPVYETLADDEAAMAEVETLARGDMWRDCVEQAGGRVLDEPEVTRVPNPTYGMVISDEGDEPLVDGVKLLIRATGLVERVEGEQPA